NVDRLGSHVSVEQGAVHVHCDGEAIAVALTAGATVTCLPTSAGRLLLRLTALLDAGATPAAVLETAQRGLAAPDGTPAVTGQLRLRTIDALLAMERWAEAAEIMDAYLEDDHPIRRQELQALRASLRRSGF
ncbi:MAG: hypothetical protein AAFV53_40500, partial [Myxococcota bacterium]